MKIKVGNAIDQSIFSIKEFKKNEKEETTL